MRRETGMPGEVAPVRSGRIDQEVDGLEEIARHPLLAGSPLSRG